MNAARISERMQNRRAVLFAVLLGDAVGMLLGPNPECRDDEGSEKRNDEDERSVARPAVKSDQGGSRKTYRLA